MEKKIQELREDIEAYKGDMEAFRCKFISRKGALAHLFNLLKELSSEKKQAMGRELNELKVLAEGKLKALEAGVTQMENLSEDGVDLTLPPLSETLGSKHPLRLIEEKVIDIFTQIGFTVATGPEIEDDWHNFSGLNFPKDHPARDMQDTFFLDKQKKWLLRTHTSNVQMRVMSKGKPPFRIVAPGRVYRNEAISARTHCMFHQIEAFYLDKEVSIADLKGILFHLIQHLFGEERKLRLRPSFFPFTSPSVEVDMSCSFCDQKGCNLCKQSGWVEVLGAGMIDPNVLKACNISEQYSGYALGMGIERIAMLYYGIEDIRLFTQNDIRFIQQFSTFH